MRIDKQLIPILSLSIVLWIIYYFLPGTMYLLLRTGLGNLILILMIILFYSVTKDVWHTAILVCVLLILFRFSEVSEQHRGKEGYENKKVLRDDDPLIKDLILNQSLLNPEFIYDPKMLQETGQLSEAELKEYQRTGLFPWSQKTIDLYTKAEESNPFIRTHPPDSIRYLRSIYPEKSMLRILAMQTKEGQFLINGVKVENPENAFPSGFGDFGYKSGLTDDIYVGKDVIKCHLEMDPKVEPHLERTVYSGYNTRMGPLKQTSHRMDYADLEKTIPGFKFIKGACNPCKGVKGVPDYSCPFELKRKEEDPVSEIWKYLWAL